MNLLTRVKRWFVPPEAGPLMLGTPVKILHGNHAGCTGTVANRQVDPVDGRMYYIVRVSGLRHTYAYLRNQLELTS